MRTYCIGIDQKLLNSLHGLFNCEIGGLDCHDIAIEYRTRVHCIFYSVVSGQYSYQIPVLKLKCIGSYHTEINANQLQRVYSI